MIVGEREFFVDTNNIRSNITTTNMDTTTNDNTGCCNNNVHHDVTYATVIESTTMKRKNHIVTTNNNNNNIIIKRNVIIFLDIDGVLLPFPFDKNNNNNEKHPMMCGIFPIATVRNLSNLLKGIENLKNQHQQQQQHNNENNDKNNNNNNNLFDEVHIVLSSTWRVSYQGCTDIISSFQHYCQHIDPTSPLQRIKDEFYDITNPSIHTERQHEIYMWLQEQNEKYEQQMYHQKNITPVPIVVVVVVCAWIALDDEELITGCMNESYRSIFEGHVVKTKSSRGITKKDTKMAIQLLQKQLLVLL